jgi:hypothetical protein
MAAKTRKPSTDDSAAPSDGVSDEKRALGSFYTMGNPFVHTGFREWMRTVPKDTTFLEPFAGSGQIVKLMSEAGFTHSWAQYDIDESVEGLHHQDTIKQFPTGYRVTITNPPYLSYHFAKRKGLAVDKEYFRGYASLYLTAISEALTNSEWVACIIPESFATCGLFTERLRHLISLPDDDMFDDTDMPTCLALWGPRASRDFKVWRCSEYLGKASELFHPLEVTPCASRIKFNKLNGQIGLKAIDGTKNASITFGKPKLCPDEKVKVSGRLLSRIHVENVKDATLVCVVANDLLNKWRVRTADFALTAFKGTREDGMFRRRLDFANARALLSQAICAVEEHDHTASSSEEAA